MSYPPPQPYGYQPYGYGPPQDHPQATVIMVIGILSVVLCQLLGPVAWVMGKRALNEIDASGGAIGGRSSVMAGYVCGIIASVLMIFGIALIVLFVAIGIAGGWDSTSSTY